MSAQTFVMKTARHLWPLALTLGPFGPPIHGSTRNSLKLSRNRSSWPLSTDGNWPLGSAGHKCGNTSVTWCLLNLSASALMLAADRYFANSFVLLYLMNH